MTKYKKTLIGFERVDNEPLEKNVVFATSAELTTYLQSDPTKYNGQVVTVKGNGTSTKGVSYRVDQLGSTWKAVPLADSEDVATKAQGGKADTAVQAATIGGTAVTKSGTTLQLPAYPTTLPASDKAAILSAAATDAQNKVNAHANDATKHITAAERNTWNAAIQSATVGGTAVPKSGTALQFPAYPTSLPASDKATILSEAATTAQSKVDAAIKTNVTDKKGALNGLATLDGSGKVPANQLPSYVDDVIELRGFDIPGSASGFVNGDLMYQSSDKKLYIYATGRWAVSGTPESGKIYVSLQDNKTYRWSGSDMAVISETLALGETSSTAYPGDKGKTNATNITNLQSNKLDKTGDGSNVTSTFTTASSRANIVSGEKLSVMMGKMAKWYEELDNTFIYLGNFTTSALLSAKLDTLNVYNSSLPDKHYTFRYLSAKGSNDLFVYTNDKCTIQVIRGSIDIKDGSLGSLLYDKIYTIYRDNRSGSWSEWKYLDQDVYDFINSSSVVPFKEIIYGTVTVKDEVSKYTGDIVWLDSLKKFVLFDSAEYFSKWKKDLNNYSSESYMDSNGNPFKKAYYDSKGVMHIYRDGNLSKVDQNDYIPISYYASKTAYTSSSTMTDTLITGNGGCMMFIGVSHFRLKFSSILKDYILQVYDECGNNITSVLDMTADLDYTILSYSGGVNLGTLLVKSMKANLVVKL